MNKDISFEKLQVADAAARRTGPANVTRQQQTGLSERQNPADSVLANQQPPSTSTGPPGLVSSSVAPGVSISGNPQNDETGFGTGVPVAGNHGTTTEPSSPYSNAHRYIRTPIFFAQPVPLIPNNDTEHTPSQASQGQEILTGVESSVQVETITAETVGPATHSANDTSLPTQSGGPSVGISNASRMPPKSLFGSPQIHAPRTSVPGNTSSTPPVDSFTTPGSSASTPSVGSTPTNPRRTMFSMLGDDHTSTGPNPIPFSSGSKSRGVDG
ncbi:hypothetical protein P280DRAFT_508268 [Massarina eburnea CBS 473.64]|uniref:Uncharacterized protein n=1 Tax=Massarina eburnea CBS 473.64 TaxID=1395130 RepID=A0A6A6RYP7_9PLEO|nr:hypothetical protein P280DRAFT_508268 [Massarina eburnea CBS 473.64]